MNEKTPDLPLFEYWICWRLMSFPRQTQLSFQLNGISRLVCMQQLFSNMYLATTRYAALKKPAAYVAFLQCRDNQTKWYQLTYVVHRRSRLCHTLHRPADNAVVVGCQRLQEAAGREERDVHLPSAEAVCMCPAVWGTFAQHSQKSHLHG